MRIDAPTRLLIRLALHEDLGKAGDITTRYFLPREKTYSARIVFKEPGVLCGSAVATEVFRRVAPKTRVGWKFRDGRRLRRGATAAVITGPRAIMTAERTALNFLQKLSGIATLTRLYVDKVRGTRAAVYDTRKTPPGWRSLAKYAVRVGGGRNHRMGLFDMAMIKDNHLAGADPEESGKRVAEFRRRRPKTPIEIEAAARAQVDTALELGADMILLDNMPPFELAREIRYIRRKSPKTSIEISGGVGLRDIGRLARLGPDRISVGRITHSAPALDISMKLT